MAEGPERRVLVSGFRIVDDTLEEMGLPGVFDLLPSPSEIIHSLGLPTLDDLAESFKARIGNRVTARQNGPRLKLPKLPGR